jgi:hypothetical protein
MPANVYPSFPKQFNFSAKYACYKSIVVTDIMDGAIETIDY